MPLILIIYFLALTFCIIELIWFLVSGKRFTSHLGQRTLEVLVLFVFPLVFIFFSETGYINFLLRTEDSLFASSDSFRLLVYLSFLLVIISYYLSSYLRTKQYTELYTLGNILLVTGLFISIYLSCIVGFIFIAASINIIILLGLRLAENYAFTFKNKHLNT